MGAGVGVTPHMSRMPANVIPLQDADFQSYHQDSLSLHLINHYCLIRGVAPLTPLIWVYTLLQFLMTLWNLVNTRVCLFVCQGTQF